jgi:Spy/CpxP family protein refolding chaperone
MTALALGALLVLTPMGRCEDNNDKASTDQTPAAAGKNVAKSRQSQFQHMAEQLKLTDEQKTKLQPILKEETTKLRELRQDTNLTAEQRRDKAREIRAQYVAKAKPILSTEQFEQFKKTQQQTGGRGPRGAKAAKPSAASSSSSSSSNSDSNSNK